MKRIIAISICVVFVLSASMVPLAQEKKDEVRAMTFGEFQEEVREIIEERNNLLLLRFNRGRYNRMPEEFALHARIVTHEGEVILGRDSAKYWKKVGQIGRNLQFEVTPEYLEFEELEVSDPPGELEINYVAYEITRFSFEGGSRGTIDAVYRHRVMCEID
ncbi:MAG: hypothetical protein E3J43_00435 [Candidatus Heimdallarchaeota archaeon]|nr:MAG: hypothetical protein E3J43_00435 [Candidatus Heimdallarchaeota archaeon]